MSDLPFDIIEQILFRLPARSLLRFNLVCKQWRSLISDPKFVKDHTNHVLLDHSNRHHRLITNWQYSREYCLWSMFILSHSIDSYEHLDSTKFESGFDRRGRPLILGCCNGLLLVVTYDLRNVFGALVLLNPVWGQKYNFLPLCYAYRATRLYGLGYTPSADDYKVVRLVQVISDPSGLQAEVYSLKTNSWKIIPGLPDITRIELLYGKAGTHVQRSIYWIACIKDNQEVVIVFDLITEKFKLIETPWGDVNLRFRQVGNGIVQVRGYLGVYRSCSVNGNKTEVWLWNEDEWLKVYTIPRNCKRYIQVLSIMNNNEVLLCVTEDYQSQKLVIYDAGRRTFRDIPCGEADSFCWPMHHMVETLVSPISGD